MFAAALFLCLATPAKAVGTSASSAILIDADSGRVLYEQAAYTPSLIASTTKIMTAYVVCENCNVLDRMEIPAEAVGIEGSSMYLETGEVLTVQDLLYGLMLQSGNDAAVALAIYCGGTVEGFVEMMNDEVRRLGLRDTHFENPNGLDAPGHHSTAFDLAVLTSAAMRNPVFARTVSTKAVSAGGRSLSNHNKLLWRYPGADGVKTGYTKAAGRILVSTAARDGRRLIAVTINAPDDWNDHMRLLDYGFSQYRMASLLQKGDPVMEIPILSGGTVCAIAAEDFSYPLAEGEKIVFCCPGPGFLFSQPSDGLKDGYVYAMIAERVIGKVPVEYICQ